MTATGSSAVSRWRISLTSESVGSGPVWGGGGWRSSQPASARAARRRAVASDRPRGAASDVPLLPYLIAVMLCSASAGSKAVPEPGGPSRPIAVGPRRRWRGPGAVAAAEGQEGEGGQGGGRDGRAMSHRDLGERGKRRASVGGLARRCRTCRRLSCRRLRGAVAVESTAVVESPGRSQSSGTPKTLLSSAESTRRRIGSSEGPNAVSAACSILCQAESRPIARRSRFISQRIFSSTATGSSAVSWWRISFTSESVGSGPVWGGGRSSHPARTRAASNRPAAAAAEDRPGCLPEAPRYAYRMGRSLCLRGAGCKACFEADRTRPCSGGRRRRRARRRPEPDQHIFRGPRYHLP